MSVFTGAVQPPRAAGVRVFCFVYRVRDAVLLPVFLSAPFRRGRRFVCALFLGGAVRAFAVDRQGVALDGKSGVTGQPFLQRGQRTAVDAYTRVAAGADEIMSVPAGEGIPHNAVAEGVAVQEIFPRRSARDFGTRWREPSQAPLRKGGNKPPPRSAARRFLPARAE